MSIRRWVLLAMVVLVVVAGAIVVVVRAQRDAGETAAPPPEPTVWERILESVGPDGRWAKREALQAFAFAFGPIPDVQLPRGRPDPPELTISGTAAVNSTLSHWDELTEPQQRAVVGALNMDEPPRLRMPAADPEDDARKVLTAEINRMFGEIGLKLGITTKVPVPTLHLADDGWIADPSVGGWTIAVGTGDIFWLGESHGLHGRAEACHVFFPPSVWEKSATALPADKQALVAHELLHCYQAFGYPTVRAYLNSPGWIQDGGAEFGAYDYTGKAWGNPSNWVHYLKWRVPLFERTYPALGWWFHVAKQGHDPWKTMPRIWQGNEDGIAAWRTAGGATPEVYESWAASAFRENRFGDRWEVHGVAVTPDRPPRDNLGPGNPVLTAEPFNPKIGEISVPTERPVVQITASRPVQVHDQGTFEDIRVTAALYCAAESCKCPDGSEPVPQKVKAPLLLAVPGAEFANTAALDFFSVKDLCEDKKKPVPPNPGPGGGVPGKPHAGSTGDPHLTGFDGNGFDFQAGGEFTLARSDSGDLEIQARQEPYREPGEPDDLSMSVNTAVAASVAGDRISLRANGSLMVDGKALAPAGEHRLPHGGTISPVRDGYRVRWPDGTTMHVLSVGDFGLNVAIEPAQARGNTLHGLLGPFTGKESPAMEDRAGKRYDYVTWDQLYKVVGESWRVDAGGSLFDYGPGESTEKFTRRDMPVFPVLTLTDEQRRAGNEACRDMPDPRLRGWCVFDVGRTGASEFADGYRTMHEVVDRPAGRDTIDQGEGPMDLRPGEQRTFTVPADPATDVYLRMDSGDNGSLDVTVSWSVTGPEGQSYSRSGTGGVSYERLHTSGSGQWTITVDVPEHSVPPPGKVSYRAVTAGPVRNVDVTLPADHSGELAGPGATDNLRFTGRKDQRITLTPGQSCPFDELAPLEMTGPDGSRRVVPRPCDGPTEYDLPLDGAYLISVTHRTVDPVGTPYRLGITG